MVVWLTQYWSHKRDFQRWKLKGTAQRSIWRQLKISILASRLVAIVLLSHVRFYPQDSISSSYSIHCSRNWNCFSWRKIKSLDWRICNSSCSFRLCPSDFSQWLPKGEAIPKSELSSRWEEESHSEKRWDNFIDSSRLCASRRSNHDKWRHGNTCGWNSILS